MKRLATHPRRLDRQPLCPPREVELEVEVLRCTIGKHLGADARETRAKAPLERPNGLPLHSVRWVTVGLSLADRLGEQALAPVRLVAVRARKVHLAAPQAVRRLAGVEVRFRRPGE